MESAAPHLGGDLPPLTDVLLISFLSFQYLRNSLCSDRVQLLAPKMAAPPERRYFANLNLERTSQGTDREHRRNFQPWWLGHVATADSLDLDLGNNF